LIKYSKAVIDQMREKHSSREGMEWLEMDVLDLQYKEEEFDLVIDKGELSS
jgi:ubiquinone/menaquinone biosynthesis C-methylase UbiE